MTKLFITQISDLKRTEIHKTLLSYALEDLGIDPEDIKIGHGENGKPFLIDHPDIHYNISHSGDYCICAVSDKPIGCDIEKIGKDRTLLVKHFFHKDEKKAYFCFSEDERATQFYRYWTYKEAYSKACGFGLTVNPDKYCIHLTDPVTVSGFGADKDWHFMQYEGIDGYIISVCGMDEGIGRINSEYNFLQ